MLSILGGGAGIEESVMGRVGIEFKKLLSP